MKAMAMKKTAALILSLAMVFTFMPLLRPEEAHALEIRSTIKVDLYTSGVETYEGAEAAAVYQFFLEGINTHVLKASKYVSGDYQLQFYDVDVDGTNVNSCDVKVDPEFDSSGKVVSLTLTKDATCTVEGDIELWLYDDTISKYSTMEENNDKGLEYFYKNILLRFDTPTVKAKENIDIDVSVEDKTFTGMDAFAIDYTLYELSRSNVIACTDEGEPGEHIYEDKYDLNKDGTADIYTYTDESADEIDGYTLTIKKEADSDIADLFEVTAPDEWIESNMEQTVDSANGLEYVFRKITFRMTPEIVANTLEVSGKTATVKFSKLRKKSQTLKASKVLKFASKGEGKLTYKKYKGNKKITINKKNGKVTVKKGLKKGLYTVKVKIKAAGDDTHEASALKTVKFKIRVK